MKLATLDTAVLNVNARTNWIFVRVRLDDGAGGVGEASLNGWEALVRAHCAQVADDFRGRDVADVRARLATYPHSPGGLVASAAKSAIEQALVDAEGRSRGMSAWQLLGGKRRDRVPVYANINRATTDRSPDGCA